VAWPLQGGFVKSQQLLAGLLSGLTGAV